MQLARKSRGAGVTKGPHACKPCLWGAVSWACSRPAQESSMAKSGYQSNSGLQSILEVIPSNFRSRGVQYASKSPSMRLGTLCLPVTPIPSSFGGHELSSHVLKFRHKEILSEQLPLTLCFPRADWGLTHSPVCPTLWAYDLPHSPSPARAFGGWDSLWGMRGRWGTVLLLWNASS